MSDSEVPSAASSPMRMSPNSRVARQSTSSLLAGLEQTNALLERFESAAKSQSDICGEAEVSIVEDHARVVGRITWIDRVVRNLLDQRNCLESQEKDLHQQLDGVSKRRSELAGEAKAVADSLATTGPSTAQEDLRLDMQMSAVEARISEMLGLLKGLDERLVSSADEERAVMVDMHEVSKLESNIEAGRRRRKVKEMELQQRKENLANREHAINQWSRALDSRETELSRAESQVHIGIKELKSEQNRLHMREGQKAAAVAAASPGVRPYTNKGESSAASGGVNKAAAMLSPTRESFLTKSTAVAHHAADMSIEKEDDDDEDEEGHLDSAPLSFSEHADKYVAQID